MQADVLVCHDACASLVEPGPLVVKKGLCSRRVGLEQHST